MEQPECISINKKSKENHQFFDINSENKQYSIEIYMETNEKKEYIIIKGYEKESISNFIYKNSFNLNQLVNMSKAFKICDNLNEAFEIVQQKLKDKEIEISLNDNLNIIINFLLPNKKTDKISFILLKEKLNENDIIEKLYKNLASLQEKNKLLEEQINNLKCFLKKKPKSLIDKIANKFKINKIILLRELYEELTNFDLQPEYLKEIGNKFQSKFKTIYNAKKDGDTISGFISKVFGKSNLAGFFTFVRLEKVKEKDGVKIKHIFGGQLGYFNGKFEFENNFLTFKKNDLFSYGTYGTYGENASKFTFFRDNNAKIYIKIDKKCVYIICYSDESYITKYVFKINEHFLINPIIWADPDFNQNEKIEDLIEEIFEQKKDDEHAITEVYLKDLKIYQIENN